MTTINAPANDRRHLPERRLTSSAMRTASLSGLDWIALLLMIVGGINWGLVGIADLDLLAWLFGAQSPLARLVYALVGLAALYGLYLLSKMATRKS